MNSILPDEITLNTSPAGSALEPAVAAVKTGGIIAYPTEAVYGLGCDPFNENAVNQLKQLKGRPAQKGFLLIASDWAQVADLVAPLTAEQVAKVQATWPGPITWVFPASQQAPAWICEYNADNQASIALRITAHPIANQLCQQLQQPIVSTSANLSSEPALKTGNAVMQSFRDKINYVIMGAVGELTKPTVIYDVLTDKILRN
ncbi:MAG: L-threonylcarbamoyladenylate synthase [Gammaproteobacteria bacterium]